MLIVVVCILGLSASAYGKTSAAGKPTLTIATDGFNSLNPALNGQANSQFTFAYEPLIHLHPDGSLTPGLALSWRYVHSSAGPNKSFELTLRRNARFSDGEPVTAQAVKTWLTYFSKAAGPLSGEVAPIRQITTIGKWTVRVDFESPQPSAGLIFSEYVNWGLVASPKAVADPSLLGSETFGAGPYSLVPSQTVVGDHYTFVPNKFFYDKSQIKFSKIILKVITSTTSTLNAVKAGQVDIAPGDVTTADAVAGSGFNVVASNHAADVYGLVLTHEVRANAQEPLRNVQVRQALNYAIDRKTITSALFGKYGQPTSAVVTTDGDSKSLANAYPYDPAKAKALLKAAGYPNGFTLNIEVPGPEGTMGAPLTEAIAKYIEAIGVKVNLDVEPTFPAYKSKIISGGYAMATQPVITNPTQLFYGLYMHPGSALFYNDPAVDKLYIQGLRAAQPGPIWKKLIKTTVTNADFVPVSALPVLYYVRKGLSLQIEGNDQFYIEDVTPTG